ncbi:MAG: STAS domain-containing protein [bacterium]|nr:STAS domain-containing protein [bacterium]
MSVKCIKTDSGKIIYEFEGKMSRDQCVECEENVMNSMNDANEIIFDLAKVDFITSSFLRLCGRASTKVSSGNFSIINTIPTVQKVFRIAGLVEYTK